MIKTIRLSKTIKQVLVLTVAVFVAIVANRYVSVGTGGVMVLTAFLVSRTARGAPLRQSLIYFLVIVVANLVVALLFATLSSLVVTGVLSAAFLLCAYLSYLRIIPNHKLLYLWVVFIVIVGIAHWLPATPLLLRNKFIDIALGAAIGFLASFLIFPVNLADEFKQALVPVLAALAVNVRALAESFSSQPMDVQQLTEHSARLMNLLQIEQHVYPEWVYDVGFNPGLRAGFRYVLVHLDRVVETVFSLHQWMQSGVDASVWQAIAAPFSDVLRKNAELVVVLQNYFEHNQIHDVASDMTADMDVLENRMRMIIPGSLELLDISPDYVLMAALVREAKDLRELLLQLIIVLPAQTLRD